jgi:NAD(P)-dependent dehydrogenase (short-subunit alcohol dehydrogenase family)
MPRDVFVTGGTGYIGRRLSAALLQRGHRVRVLTRPASAGRVPDGARAVMGDALDAGSFLADLGPDDTLVHLVGTPHPSPAKAAEFRRVDLPSIEASVTAASAAGVAHLVYVSVAHPAPVMAAYIAVRSAGEAAIARARLTATVLRPWYVLGPGHWWPVVLLPIYGIFRLASAANPQIRPGLILRKWKNQTRSDFRRNSVESRVQNHRARGLLRRRARRRDPQRRCARVGDGAQSAVVSGDRDARPHRGWSDRALAGHHQGRIHARRTLVGGWVAG